MKNSLTIYFPNYSTTYRNVTSFECNADGSVSFKASADTVRLFGLRDLKLSVPDGTSFMFHAPFMYKDYSSLPEGELPEEAD